MGFNGFRDQIEIQVKELGVKLRSLEGQGGAETVAKGFDVEKEKRQSYCGQADRPGGSAMAQHGHSGTQLSEKKASSKELGQGAEEDPGPLPVYSSLTSSSGASHLSYHREICTA